MTSFAFDALTDRPTPPKSIFHETPEQRDARRAWWTHDGCGKAPEGFATPPGTTLTYNKETNRLYVHLLDYPSRFLPITFADKIEYAQFLHDGSEVKVHRGGVYARNSQAGDLGKNDFLRLPTKKPDVEIPVVEIFLKPAKAAPAQTPTPQAAGVKVYDQPGWCVWCPSPVALPDGRFALVHSRWREADGFEAWCAKSEAALAISEKGPLGPYRFAKTLLAGSGRDGDFDRDVVHNPQVLVDGGKYYLFYMGTYSDLTNDVATGASSSGTAKGSFRMNQRIGVAWADSIEGPWHRSGRPILPEVGDCIMSSNPSVVRMPDGRYLMVFKWGWPPALPWPYCRNSCAAAIADSPLGPWKVVSKDIFPVRCANFPGEDPCLWLEGDEICCSIHDNGRFYAWSDRALILFKSRDGVNWTNQGELFPRGDIERLERPFVLAQPGGCRLLFAASKPRRGSPHSEILAFPGVLSESGACQRQK